MPLPQGRQTVSMPASPMRRPPDAAPPPYAPQLLKKAVAGGDILWGAYALGNFYRASTPLMDAAKAAEK